MNYTVIAASIKKTIIGRKTKTLIAALLLAASSAFAQVPSYVPTNGLVGWWPFNANANDESGNGNNGIVNGATLINDRFGNSNKSYLFDGNTSFIQVSNSSTLKLRTKFTLSVWYKTDSLVQSASAYRPTMISQERYLNGSGIQLGYGPNQFVEFGINNSPIGICPSCNLVISGNSIIVNQWNHLVGIWDNDSLFIFQNSILISRGNGVIPNDSLLSSTMPLIFGKAFTSNNPPYPTNFKGNLDDIGIWNRALSQQEITALYNAQSCVGNISADGPTTFCAGNSVNLKSDVVGGTYQWRRNGINITTNGTSQTFKATLTGSYTCVATCNGTALTSNAIAVTSKTNASATVTASGATSFCLGDSLTLNCTNLGSNYSVQWYRTNVSMENATNYSLVVKQPGTYKVVTRNLTNGCSRISGSAITTSVNCRIAGDVTSAPTSEENTNNAARLIDNELSHGVHIYPNPNNGSFNFTYDGEETGAGVLQIINTMGQSIYSSAVSIQEGGYTQEINLGDNYTKGFYIVRLLINGGYNDSRVMVR